MNDLCPSCGQPLERGLSECPGCGGKTPLRTSLVPKAVVKRVAVILTVIAVGLLFKLLLLT